MKTSVSHRQRWLVVILLITAALLLLIPFYVPGDLPYLLLLVGRFHPVVLHFPIVLIVLALILELMRRSRMLKSADAILTAILVAAALSSLVAIGSGFFLYGSGDYSGSLMSQHLWVGVITGISIFVTSACFLLYRNSSRWYPIYFAGLLVSNGAVAFASHLGGSVTHGENYLTEYVPMLFAEKDTQTTKAPADMLVYEDVIMPVFESKCNSCHNENRKKGELSMVSFDAMLKGGESGDPAIVPGIPDSSEIYRRIILPEGHEDRMPPEGKNPLTTSEVMLLKHWIVMGASTATRVEEIKGKPEMGEVVDDVLPGLARYRRKQELAKTRDRQLERELKNVAMELNIHIEADSMADERAYMVMMKFPPGSFTSGQLARLVPYGEAFSRLSLVSSSIEDDGLYHLSKMPNVTALYLQKTKLKGSGIVHLQRLQQLEVLNISYTDVDDKSALDLLKIPNLREVYVFRSNISPEMIKALQDYRPSMRILAEEGPYR